jgi:hypothetical protein
MIRYPNCLAMARRRRGSLEDMSYDDTAIALSSTIILILMLLLIRHAWKSFAICVSEKSRMLSSQSVVKDIDALSKLSTHDATEAWFIGRHVLPRHSTIALSSTNTDPTIEIRHAWKQKSRIFPSQSVGKSDDRRCQSIGHPQAQSYQTPASSRSGLSQTGYFVHPADPHHLPSHGVLRTFWISARCLAFQRGLDRAGQPQRHDFL